MRKSNDGSIIRLNSDNIGKLWYIVLDEIRDVLYYTAKQRADITIKNLENAGWIVRNLNTGYWEINKILGSPYVNLLHSIDPNTPTGFASYGTRIMHSAIDFSSLDSTGWSQILRRPISGNSYSNSIPWIERILRGLPHRNVDIPYISNAQNVWADTVHMQSIENEILTLVDTIENFVGPESFLFSLLWRTDPNYFSPPNLDVGYENGASMTSILDEKEGASLSSATDMLAYNDYQPDVSSWTTWLVNMWVGS